MPPSPVFTVGHSTRSFEELAALLISHGIKRIVDVRRFPGSRRHPQFSLPEFENALHEAGVAYTHLESLGGRRKPEPESRNTALRNVSFRAYADHMATAEFARGIDTLLELPGPAAVMCAEAVPWRCHRNLLSDELVRRGCEVIHLIDVRSKQTHKMSELAREENGVLVYRVDEPQKELF